MKLILCKSHDLNIYTVTPTNPMFDAQNEKKNTNANGDAVISE